MRSEKKSTRSRAFLGATLAVIGCGSCISTVHAQEAGPAFPIVTPDDARTHGLEDLRTAVRKDGGVPLPDLRAFIKPGAERKLQQLGKLLFWDQSVGSDGQACASCHYHAGADIRRNSVGSPGLLNVENTRDGDIRGHHLSADAPDTSFQTISPGETIAFDDFPLVKFPGQLAENGAVVGPAPGNSNDAVSSPGVTFKRFDTTVAAQVKDECTALTDDVFHDGLVNQRRVPPRNSPTVINAVFNAFNFWDGRANHYFNGQNAFGVMDPTARVLRYDGASDSIRSVRLSLKNSSLASQSVGPANSDFEMACGDSANGNVRAWPEVGKKLVRPDQNGVTLRALENQAIHPDDSLLGEYSRGSTTNGADVTYRQLIEETFREEWWQSGDKRVLLGDASSITVVDRPADQSSTILFPRPRVAPLTAEEAGSGVRDMVSEGGGKASGRDARGPAQGSGAPGRGRPLVESEEQPRFTVMEANMALFFGLAVQAYEATLVADDSRFDKWMRGEPGSGFGDPERRGLNVFVEKGKCINCHGGPELTNASVRNFQNGGNLIEPMVMGDRDFALYDNGFYNIAVTPTVEDIGRGGRGPLGTPLASSRQLLFAQVLGEEIPHKTIGDDGVLGVTEDEGEPVCNEVGADGRCTSPVLPAFHRAAVDGAFKTPGLRNIELQGPYFHNGGVATLAQVVEFYDNGGNFCQFNIDNLDPDIVSLELTPAEKTDLVRFLQSLTDDRVSRERAPFDHPSLVIPGDGNEDGAVRRLPAIGAAGSSKALEKFLGLDPASLGSMDAGFVCSPDETLG